MKIIITGAGGLVGGACARRFARSHQVLALRHADLDVTDGEAVRRRILSEMPQLVVNCAVLGVDECERDPESARAINVEAPRALACAAAETRAEFLHFSSNYVFGGDDAREFYTTDDEPRPVNVYGRTKLAGERAAREANARSYVVRTSWVFGAGKASSLSTAHRELLAGRSMRAITDTRASVTYVEDLARRVEEILGRRVPGRQLRRLHVQGFRRRGRAPRRPERCGGRATDRANHGGRDESGRPSTAQHSDALPALRRVGTRAAARLARGAGRLRRVRPPWVVSQFRVQALACSSLKATS